VGANTFARNEFEASSPKMLFGWAVLCVLASHAAAVLMVMPLPLSFSSGSQTVSVSRALIVSFPNGEDGEGLLRRAVSRAPFFSFGF
jgi:hypothetical protein